MHILLIGAEDILTDWLEQLSPHHTCYVSEPAEPLIEAGAVALDEEKAARVEILFDTTISSARAKAELLGDVVRAMPDTVNVVSNTVLTTVTELGAALGIIDRIAGFGYLPTLLDADILEVTIPYSADNTLKAVLGSLFEPTGKKLEFIDDAIGFVFSRVLATIVNEAAFTMQQGVADEAAIDTAMKLGVNYPDGPFGWGRKIGFGHIYTLLQVLHLELGDARYRPAPLLKKLALTEA